MKGFVQPVSQQREQLYSNKQVTVNGIHGRERGLSASALDQGRVASQIRNKNDARNYSVGVHKKMHGNSAHPSQPNIVISQPFSHVGPDRSPAVLNSTAQSGRPSMSGKKQIKTIPVRSPQSLNRASVANKQMINFGAQAEKQMNNQMLPDIRTQQIQSSQKVSMSVNPNQMKPVSPQKDANMAWKVQASQPGMMNSNQSQNRGSGLQNPQIMPQFINQQHLAYQKQIQQHHAAQDAQNRTTSPTKQMGSMPNSNARRNAHGS